MVKRGRELYIYVPRVQIIKSVNFLHCTALLRTLYICCTELGHRGIEGDQAESCSRHAYTPQIKLAGYADQKLHLCSSSWNLCPSPSLLHCLCHGLKGGHGPSVGLGLSSDPCHLPDLFLVHLYPFPNLDLSLSLGVSLCPARNLYLFLCHLALISLEPFPLKMTLHAVNDDLWTRFTYNYKQVQLLAMLTSLRTEPCRKRWGSVFAVIRINLSGFHGGIRAHSQPRSFRAHRINIDGSEIV